jgi:hypothetical protein
MFRSMIIIREHMQFLAEECKMLKLSVKHFVKMVWQHIVLMHVVLSARCNNKMVWQHIVLMHVVLSARCNNKVVWQHICKTKIVQHESIA